MADGLGFLLGLHLMQRVPLTLVATAERHRVRPSTAAVTTKQEAFLPPVVQSRKPNPHLATFDDVCEGFLFLVLGEKMEAL